MAEYMRDVYDRAVTDPSQPLIMAKHGDSLIQLVPEFCRIDGVPETIRASPAMRDCLAVCRVTPDQKMQDIKSVVGLLSQQPVLQDWNLSIEDKPIDLKG